MSKLKKIISIFTKNKNVPLQNVIDINSLEIDIVEKNDLKEEKKQVSIEWYENTTEF